MKLKVYNGQLPEYPYFVTVTKVMTGKTIRKRFTFPDDDLARFMFGNGNYACDCNRALFFGDDCSCSDHLYTVKVEDAINQTIYED